MATLSPFIDEIDNYVLDRNILKHYHIQAAKYLSVMKGYDYEKTLELIARYFIPDENGFKEKRLAVFEKNKLGDRIRKVYRFREYLNKVEQNNYHLSPSLVAYTHTDEEECVNAIGTLSFINDRNFYKNKRQTVPKGTDDWTAFNEIQNALKIFNNAQSGAMSSGGTPISNKSGHTTLTSTTRCLTSTVNLFNERLITGNRLLLSFDKTMELFVSTLTYTNRELIQKVIRKYKLNYATVEQVMSMVRRCSYYYYNNPKQFALIEEFLTKLTKLDLTILLCSMDIMGLYETNPEFTTKYIKDWLKLPEFPSDVDTLDYGKPANGDYYNLCVFKLGKEFSKGQLHYLNNYHVEVEEKYRDFIEAFFKVDIPPSSIYSVRDIVRESVTVSDTDSSVYSLDGLIDKFCESEYDVRAFTGVMGYFIRCIAVDQHGRLSKNMNISKRHNRLLTMKPEYSWSASFVCLLTKHYWSLEVMIEGVLNAEKVLESKGVHIKSSKAPALVREFRDKLMWASLYAVEEGNQLCASELLHNVAELERAVIEDTSNGLPTWLESKTIKDGDSYKDADVSIYYYHTLWDTVFADKYGGSETLPYRAYKVVLTTDTKTKLNTFLEENEGTALATKLRSFIDSGTRDRLTSLYVPVEIGLEKGIPKEILSIVDYRAIISQNLKSIYVILEALGLFILNSKTTRLISDEH